jgi:phage terminase Nu1 subunit (DNA packaging protein)
VISGPTENEVDAPTLARVLGCDVRTMHLLARKGLCVRVGRNRYELFQSIGNVVEHYRRQAAGHTSADGKADAMKSNAALKDAQRRLLDFKYEQLNGQLLSIAEIEALWGDLVDATRVLFMLFPARARGDLPHLTNDDLNTLERLSLSMLREVAVKGRPPLPTPSNRSTT